MAGNNEFQFERKPTRIVENLISNWKPIHTSIVMDSISGLSNDTIAGKYGYTSASISNILRTRQAQNIRDAVNQQVLEQKFADLPDQIKAIRVKAFERIQTFLQNDELAEKNPFAFFDRALKSVDVIADITGSKGHASVTNVQQNNIFTSPEKMQALTDGLNAAFEVAERYAEIPSGNVDGSTPEPARITEGRRVEEGFDGRTSQALKIAG